jgi:CheY-like chemotaxis protein
VVRGSEGLLRRVLGEDVALEVMLGADLWPICWDPGHLEQVLMNLVVNARDAMLQGGRLRLSTRNERVGEEAVVPAGDWVVVQVKDWGTGMSAEVKAHLFEPFFTTKEHGRGTGLGLATIYGLVTQAGGNVQVDSELGQGTSIDVFLPRSAATGAVVAPAAALRARGGDETVLVVEDDPMVRAVTTRALVSGGYRVLVAGEGAEALKLARQQRVDLVVSDVVMPGLDGPTLVKALRAESPSLRALLVSGYTHDVLEDHDVEASGLQFLTKPFTGQGLLTKVRAVLDARERSGATPVPK